VSLLEDMMGGYGHRSSSSNSRWKIPFRNLAHHPRRWKLPFLDRERREARLRRGGKGRMKKRSLLLFMCFVGVVSVFGYRGPGTCREDCDDDELK